jgi:predicted class III extradiol MEMO1 family dioxygenase
MESDQVKTRSFTHYNLFTFEGVNSLVKEPSSDMISKLGSKLQKDIDSQTISFKDRSTGLEKLNPEKIYLKALFLPYGNYNLVSQHISKGYKLLQNSSTYNDIKRIFLISHSNLTDKKGIFLSAYGYYRTIFGEKFPIDQQVYDELFASENIKKYTEKYEISSFNFSTFYEEGGLIKERNEELSDSIEDREFVFDLHLAMLNVIFDSESNIQKGEVNNTKRRITIVPIWVNVRDTAILSSLTDVLAKYMFETQNFFIFSTNLTHFGRLYNYFSDDKKFKSRQFLRDKANEEAVRQYITKMNTMGIDMIKTKKIDELLSIDDYIFSKDVLLLLSHLYIKLTGGQVRRRTHSKSEPIDKGSTLKLDIDEILYSIERVDTVETEYEINLVSYLSLIIYNNK